MKYQFSSLSLGSRFKYREADDKIYVKIGANEIAEWNPDRQTERWIGQGVYCFSQDNELDREVVVIFN